MFQYQEDMAMRQLHMQVSDCRSIEKLTNELLRQGKKCGNEENPEGDTTGCKDSGGEM